MTERAVRDYIYRGRHSVPGWLERVDALLLAAIDESQRQANLVGNIMEIGTYMGRCTVLLGYFRRAGERLVVCDLFDGYKNEISEENAAEQAGSYGDLTRQAFERNFLRFHSRLPDDIIAAPSVALHERIGNEYGKTFRIIHIDGSHEYAAVQGDILLSRELLADGGMVVFDDVNARHTPGVAAAVWGAVINEGLIPHLVTSKLYASWTPILPTDLSLPSAGWTWTPHMVAGYSVLHPQETGGNEQRLRNWIPPILVPALTSINQRIRGRMLSIRPSP